MGELPDTYVISKFNQYETNNISRSITNNEMEAIIKSDQLIEKSPGPDGVTEEFP